MSPDSSLEERVTRQEERHTALRRELNAAMNSLRERALEDRAAHVKLVADLREFVETEFGELKEETKARSRERRAMWTTTVVAVIGLIANLALQLLGSGGPHS